MLIGFKMRNGDEEITIGDKNHKINKWSNYKMVLAFGFNIG
jgi:hypothetical protein